jgi:hypothetical protein
VKSIGSGAHDQDGIAVSHPWATVDGLVWARMPRTPESRSAGILDEQKSVGGAIGNIALSGAQGPTVMVTRQVRPLTLSVTVRV